MILKKRSRLRFEKTIVISAVNLRSGGPLSILQDCLSFLQQELVDNYRVIALVHDKSLLHNVANVEFIEFPKSVNFYLYRLYYEYIYFKRLSQQLKPYLWLSLHDMTPNVEADVRAVYCHNSSPFFRLRVKDIIVDPTFALFNLLYKQIYRVNISKNDYVIVQQNWLRDKFQGLYKMQTVVVAYPDIQSTSSKPTDISLVHNNCQFFFPTLSRFFKNIEVIIASVKIINKKSNVNFNVTITLDGTENSYAKAMLKCAKGLDNIKFIGRISRDEVFEWYEKSDCLIFPSKLETWGLPITEFKSFNKPMLVADLPYAYETVGDYEQVSFFETDNAQQLADMMLALIEGKSQFIGNKAIKVTQPYTENWSELFSLLLSDN